MLASARNVRFDIALCDMNHVGHSFKMDTMEWTNEAVIELIHAYRDRPELWDPSNNFYKIAARRLHAWHELAKIFHCNPLEIKKKINSLLASFRRERQKVRASYESDEVRRSSWFAYKHLDFLNYPMKRTTNSYKMIPGEDEGAYIQGGQLLDGDASTEKMNSIYLKVEKPDNYSLNEPHEEMDIGKDVIEEESTFQRKTTQEDVRMNTFFMRVENSDNDPLTELQEEDLVKDDSLSKLISTRKRCRENFDTDDVLRMLKRANDEKRDDCDVYGMHVANKLRMLDYRSRCIVQHRINNVIFEVEMERYSAADTNTQSPYRSNDTTSFTTQFCSPQLRNNPVPSSPNPQTEECSDLTTSSQNCSIVSPDENITSENASTTKTSRDIQNE